MTDREKRKAELNQALQTGDMATVARMTDQAIDAAIAAAEARGRRK